MIRTGDVLEALTSGSCNEPVLQALVRFTARYGDDFQVLMAFALAMPKRHRALVAVLTVVYDEVKAWAELEEAMACGEANAFLFEASDRYADALLRLDEWLLAQGLRAAAGRDEYSLDWLVERV